MAANEEEQTADIPHFERGLIQVRETRYLVDGWDTERGAFAVSWRSTPARLRSDRPAALPLRTGFR